MSELGRRQLGTRELGLDVLRRRGYLILCLGAAIVHTLLAVMEWPRGNWHPVLGAVICVALLAVILNPRVSLHRMDHLLGLTTDIGAVITIWSISSLAGPFSAQTSLIFVMFFALWFGVLPMKAATLRTALLYAAILTVGLLRQPIEIIPLMYMGFLALLIGQMTFSGRQIRLELSETARYADLALTDPLTNLHNRRSMITELQRHLSTPGKPGNQSKPGDQGKRKSGPVAVLLADIDHFKNVNDSYGHEVGDQVLQHVAGVLVSCVRPGDYVARWGGEEFLMMVRTDDREAMQLIAKRILYTLRTVSSGLPPVTLSIGVAFSNEAADINALLRLADRRLYRAKRAGRNQMNMEPLSANTTMLDGHNARSSAPSSLS